MVLILLGALVVLGVVFFVFTVKSDPAADVKEYAEEKAKEAKAKKEAEADEQQKINESLKEHDKSGHDGPSTKDTPDLARFDNQVLLENTPPSNTNPEVIDYQHPYVLFQTVGASISLYNIDTKSFETIDSGTEGATLSDDNRYVVYASNGLNGKAVVYDIENKTGEVFRQAEDAKIFDIGMANGVVAFTYQPRNEEGTYHMMSEVYFDYREGRNPTELKKHEVKNTGVAIEQIQNQIYYTKENQIIEIHPGIGDRVAHKVTLNPTQFIFVNGDVVYLSENQEVYKNNDKTTFENASQLFTDGMHVYVHKRLGLYTLDNTEETLSDNVMSIHFQENDGRFVYIQPTREAYSVDVSK